ncbi:MAG: nucleotidyltransferase family protein [bacterium]
MTIEEQIILSYAIPQLDHEDTCRTYRETAGWKKVSWDRVLKLALFHDVFPSVYHHLEYIGWSDIPAEVVAKFRKEWRQHLARNIILSDELNRILGLFAGEKVKAIPLKGALLAELFYPDMTLRSFSDLDIWIRPMDIEMAGELLQQLGYEQYFHLDGSKAIENVCDILFYRCLRAGPRISVELHHRLVKTRDYPAIPEEEWWHQTQEIWINGQRYFSLAPDDMLIYLTIKIHASAYCYLKQFIDLHQLLTLWGSKLNWECIYQTAEKTGMLNNLLFVLVTLEHLFAPYGISIPHAGNNHWVRSRMGPVRLHFFEHIFNRQTILRGRYGRDLRKGLCLLLNDRMADSITSCLRVLFPSSGAICARYLTLPRSKKFYLYYCLNPFLIIYWLFRGLVVKSTDGHGLGTLLGPVNQK